MTDRDETQLRRQLRHGESAQRVLESEAFKKAMASLEEEFISEWRDSAPEDEETRRNAYLMQRLLRKFEEQFRIAIANGAIAQSELLNTGKVDNA